MRVRLSAMCWLALCAAASAQDGRGTMAARVPAAFLNGMQAKGIPATTPTPRMANGKPDLSGLWRNDASPAPPPQLLPWAEKIQKERQQNRAASASSPCLPSGAVPIVQNFPYQLVHTSSMLVILQDMDYPGWSQIFLDGREHPQDWNPAWFGHSTGKWDGDTLVVDTIGFNDTSLLQGAPHTEQLHAVVRIRRPDAGHLDIEITAEDPGAWSGVWKRHITATLAGKDEEITEHLCENGKTPQERDK